jgi:hypothetical protein
MCAKVRTKQFFERIKRQETLTACSAALRARLRWHNAYR